MKSEAMIVFLCFLSVNSLMLSEKKSGKLKIINHDHYECSCSKDCKESANCCPVQTLCNSEKNFELTGNFTFDSYENNLNPEIENIVENTENSFNENEQIHESINSENELANADLLDMANAIRSKKTSSVEEVKRRLKTNRILNNKRQNSNTIISPKSNNNHSYEAALPKIDLNAVKLSVNTVTEQQVPADSSSPVEGTLSNANIEPEKPNNSITSISQPDANSSIQKLNETIDNHSKLLDKTNGILENINKSFIDSKVEKSDSSQNSSEGKSKAKDCLSVTTNQLNVKVKAS